MVSRKGVYYASKEERMTWGDKIRSMTDEELAQVVRYPCDIVDHYPAGWCKERNCGYRCALEWLKQEAVDNGACSADETSEKVQDE